MTRKDNNMEELSHVGMLNCWICGEGAEILLDTRLRNTMKRNMGSRPDIFCTNCESQAKDNNGIWLISVKNGEQPQPNELFNPHRTGNIVLIKKDALKRMFKASLNKDLLNNIIPIIDKNIYFYLEDKTWDIYGLPR